MTGNMHLNPVEILNKRPFSDLKIPYQRFNNQGYPSCTEGTGQPGVNMTQFVQHVLCTLGVMSFAHILQTVSACDYQLVKCESWGFKYAKCALPGRVSYVDLLQKYSNSDCKLYKSYGPLLTENAMWVDHGCRGQFLVKYCHPGQCHEIWTSCSSHGFKPADCEQSGYIIGVHVVKKISKSACQYGKSYGFKGKQLWVDHGCRAKFSLTVC